MSEQPRGLPVSKQNNNKNNGVSESEDPPPAEVSQGLAGGKVKNERREGRRNTTARSNPSIISRKETAWKEGSGRNQNGRENNNLPYSPNTSRSYSCAHTSPQSVKFRSTSSGDLPQSVGSSPAVLTLPARRVRGNSSAR